MSTSASVRAVKIPPELGMLLMASALGALAEAGPCDDPGCEACAGLRDERAGNHANGSGEQGINQADDAALRQANLAEHMRQHIEIQNAARVHEDLAVVDMIEGRIRTTSAKLLDADLQKGHGRSQREVDELAARVAHLRNMRALLLARSAPKD